MAEWTTENEFDRPSSIQVPFRKMARKKNGTATITELTDRQLVIFETIKNGTVNAQNLSVALGISLRTTKRDLYVLRDMNLIHYAESD